jgi:hypothetical protein
VASRNSRFYRDVPDDPEDRQYWFWTQVSSYSSSVLRTQWGQGEEHFRDYVQRWQYALGLSEGRWLQIVRKKKRPLEHLADDWELT